LRASYHARRRCGGSCGRSGLFEAIAVLVDRGETPAMLATELEFLAQAADVRVDGARRHRGAEVPDVLEQRVAADDAAVAAEQEAGEVEFALGQLDFATVDGDAPALRVDLVRAEFERVAAAAFDVVAAQDGRRARAARAAWAA
jgi:hypothetical protein